MRCLPSCVSLLNGLLDRAAGRFTGRGAGRVPGLPLFWVGLVCVAPWFVPAGAAAHPTGSLTSPAAGQPSPQDHGRGRAPKKRRKHGKVGNLPGRKAGAPPGRSMAAAHPRARRHQDPAGAAQPPKLALLQSPGPAQTPEALRARDKVRHMQIERAEDAARRQELTNRWQTVNFLISGVDEQRYPAAGFWKLLSCYRRGRISEGDSTRQRCHLSPSDLRALDSARSVALMLTAKNGGPAPADATLSVAVAASS